MTATKYYVVEGDETSEYHTDPNRAEEAAAQVVDDWEGEGDLPRPKIAEMAIMPWSEYEAMLAVCETARTLIDEADADDAKRPV